MSSIKLSPSASGSGEFTIAAPNSNTNRTLNLPDTSGTVVTKSGSFIAPSELASGTANNTTFLRGDNTWQTIAGVDTTSVLNATAGASVGAVGTYAFLRDANTVTTAGTTRAASALHYSNNGGTVIGGQPSGTWRCMGDVRSDFGGAVTVFLRIS